MNHVEPLESDEWKPKAARKRKDTKHWCKGKVGREHTPHTVITKWPYGRTECGMASVIYASWWSRSGKHIWSKDRWVCFHEIHCSTCGKILKTSLPRDKCPKG